jgi:trimeric autotransporter adhesin
MNPIYPLRSSYQNLLILLLIGGTVALSAQIPFDPAFILETEEDVKRETNIAFLLDFARRDSVRYHTEKEQAIQRARLTNSPVRGKSGAGGSYELQGFDAAGQLLYYMTNNHIAANTISTNRVRPGGSAGLNLTGQGQTIRMWDAGLVRHTHQEFGNRVINVDAGAMHDHATHVTGTLAAAGVNSPARGMAYNANVRARDWNNDLSEMSIEAANNARVSNHSYGPIAGWLYNGDLERWEWWGNESISTAIDWKFGFYDAAARDIDNIVVNTPFFLPVKSAGNNRNIHHTGEHWVRNAAGVWVSSTTPRSPNGVSGGYDCIPTWGTAKNILTIGAVDDLATGYNPNGNPSQVVMSSFSSWGPTDDGRIKPDLVANGVGVFSTTWESDSSYGNKNGTSMSSPSIAGSIALINEHVSNLFSGATLRASAMKALLIHTADECGTAPGPDYRFGWGLMNTEKAVEVLSNENGRHLVVSRDSLFSGHQRTYQIYHDGIGGVKVTIAWTDPAGPVSPASLNPTTRRLVNDLDLSLRSQADGTLYHPWVLDPSDPAAPATQGNNIRDNVEQVYVASLPAGFYTVQIGHKLSALAGGKQIFSMILSGRSTPCSTVPENLSVTSIGYAHIGASWNPVPGASNYQLRYRVLPEGDWNSFNWSTNTSIIMIATPCTTFELQVRAGCGSDFSEFSNSITAQTPGCEDNYCYSYGFSPNHWIIGVAISDLDNNSGNGYGHSDFTNLQSNVVKGHSYPITLTPGTNVAGTTVYWRVWIDYNGDGDFTDNGEQAVSITGSSLSPVSATISIPTEAATGTTRMRVSLSLTEYPESCSTDWSPHRDVEDYTINIQPAIQQPVANFTANITSGTAPLSVQFSDQSTNTPTSWMWDFGNGQTSTQQNPVVTYHAAGTYTVSLTATNAAGANTFTRTGYITVSPAAPWTASPTGENHTVIIPATLNATLDGAPLQNGDVIGFFYEHNGSLHCSNFVAITGANNSVAVYGNDANPPAKNGFATGEPFKVKIYQASTQQEFDAQATYAPVGTAGIVTHTHQYANDGISMLSGLTASTATVLDIPLQQGWNMISSYVQPADGNMLEVFSPIAAATILVKDNLGATTIPSLNINNIGAWQIVEGYKVRVNANTTLSITGTRVDPSATPVPIATGWQIISYLREQQASVPTVLASISGIVEVLKDNAGNSYIPEFGINTMGNMRPTQGYKLKASGNGTLNYPPNFAPDGQGYMTETFSGTEKRSPRYFVLDSTHNTGNNSLIIFPASVAGTMMQEDDEVGVFTTTGILCGAGVFQGNNFAVTVWGDDATTLDVVEGMMPGEAYVFKMWKHADELELPLQVTFAQGSGFYAEDAVDVVESLQIVSAVKNVRSEWLTLSVFPNPASDWLTVLLPEDVQVLEIRDAAGRLLQRIPAPGNAPYQVNAAGFPRGLLLLSARDGQGRRWHGRVVLQ